jgi:hypothetical protein
MEAEGDMMKGQPVERFFYSIAVLDAINNVFHGIFILKVILFFPFCPF